MTRSPRVAIIGAGIEGASAAFYLAHKHAVVAELFDPDPYSGASQVAAGMLAPVAEAVYGEEGLLEIMLEAARDWIGLDATLRDSFGLDCGYRGGGSLLVAVGPNDAAEVERTWRFYRKLGLDARIFQKAELAELEPQLSPDISMGIYAKIDNQVDNRAAHRSLISASRTLGVTLTNSRVTEISPEHNGWRVQPEIGSARHFDKVVVAAGVRAGEIEGLPGFVSSVLRPIRGQVIRLAASEIAPAPSLVIRSLWQGRGIYVVGRKSGEVVIGASAEEVGFDPTRRARTTYELLRDAFRVLPGLGEMHLEEINVGYRPGTPDNAPLLGEIDDGLILDLGHFRHGILLASVTGKWIADEVVSPGRNQAIKAFDPARFAKSQGGGNVS